MADRFYLTLNQVQRLEKMLRAFEAGDLSRSTPVSDHRFLETPATVWGLLDLGTNGTTDLASPPKTTGNTLNVYALTSTGGTTDTGVDVTVLNPFMAHATTDRWVVAQKDSQTDHYILQMPPHRS